jgi:DNA-binding XRE family transcriptional regulator
MSDDNLRLRNRPSSVVKRVANAIPLETFERHLIDNDDFRLGSSCEAFQYEFAKRIKQIRIAAGYSQRDLASLVGTTQAAINKIESCNAPANPTMDTVWRLAFACGFLPRIEFDLAGSIRKVKGV